MSTSDPVPSSSNGTLEEFDRLAVVTIQGGGVYGLNMLGQLAEVIDYHEIDPMAYAGTSAGAVVAAFSWAGYTPEEISGLFVARSVEGPGVPGEGRETIVDFLGPFDGDEGRFDYPRFKWLVEYLKKFGRLMSQSLGQTPTIGPGPSALQSLEFTLPNWLVGAIKAVTLVSIILGIAWGRDWIDGGTLVLVVSLTTVVVVIYQLRELFRGLFELLRTYLAVVDSGEWWVGPSAISRYERFLEGVRVRSPGFAVGRIQAALDALRVARELQSYAYGRRGFFSGDQFEAFLDDCLRASPKFAPYREEIGEDALTFGRIRKLWDDHADDPTFGIVPLILTATNLTTRELVLITSYEDKFDDLPVARAVRASAGFPVFFQPVEVSSPKVAGWYVDGGVISNFPSWVFSRTLRAKLAGIKRYRNLATFPWLNIGLRVGPDTSPDPTLPDARPGEFVRSMFDLTRGQVRNQLEKELTANLPRTILIDQPKSQTNAPPDILDVDQLTDDKILAMFLLGARFARRRMEQYSFKLPSFEAGQPIDLALKRLIDQVLALFPEHDHQAAGLRANIFLPSQQKLVIAYAHGMDKRDDHDLQFDYDTGVTGYCFINHRPYLANLRLIRAWADQVEPEAKLLGLTARDHQKVRDNRTWLACMPIFDPMDCWLLESIPPRTMPEPGVQPVWSQLSANLDGALFGVLNLDSAMPYDIKAFPEDTERSLTIPRIQSMFGLMESCSFELGRLFSQAYAKERDHHGQP